MKLGASNLQDRQLGVRLFFLSFLGRMASPNSRVGRPVLCVRLSSRCDPTLVHERTTVRSPAHGFFAAPISKQFFLPELISGLRA